VRGKLGRGAWRYWSGIALGLWGLVPDGVAAQTIDARTGRFFNSGDWTVYRLGIKHPLTGILGAQLHADLLHRYGGSPGGLVGVGADLTAFRTGRDGPYLIAGLSGGFGSETSNALSDGWGSWSAGMGYDLFPLSFLSVGAEARWRELSLGKRNGLELAGGVTVYLSGGSPPPRPLVQRPQPASSVAISADSAPGPSVPGDVQSPPGTLADSIIATATEAMGRPYEFGGTGANGEGFDCSGLIQYAYGKHGITLPRRSTEQAREGTKVERKVAQLKPGDLLTFSNRGGPVTHVGLYMGKSRFIHSATRGVQVSTLSAVDPYGRWWYQRWVGVRRLIP
jgi:cell wall-associated NlpC family hydrolase